MFIAVTRPTTPLFVAVPDRTSARDLVLAPVLQVSLHSSPRSRICCVREDDGAPAASVHAIVGRVERTFRTVAVLRSRIGPWHARETGNVCWIKGYWDIGRAAARIAPGGRKIGTIGDPRDSDDIDSCRLENYN